MQIKPKEYKYSTSVRWTKNHEGVLSADSKPDIQVACPPEFCGGLGGIWAPEDMFVASIEVCIMMTFLWLAERKKLSIVSYKSNADGIAKWDKGSMRFVNVVVYPKIKIKDESDSQKASDLMKKAEEICLVSKSLTTEVEVKADISV